MKKFFVLLIVFIQLFTITLFADGITYIKTGKIFTGYELKENLILAIKDGYFKDVFADASRIPASAKVIDASNYFILPGFIDVNAHFLSPSNQALSSIFEKGYNFLFVEYKSDMVNNRYNALSNGITAVYDTGDNIDDLLEIKTQALENNIIGPRIYFSGPLFTCANGYVEGLLYKDSHYFHDKAVFEFSNASNAITKLLELKKLGINFVTIAYAKYNVKEEFDRLPLNVVTEVIKQAHILNLDVFAIVSTDQEALDMVKAGIDGIEKCFKITNQEIKNELFSLMAQKKVFFTPDLLSVKNFEPAFLPDALQEVRSAYLAKIPIVIGSYFPASDGSISDSYFSQMALLKEAGLSDTDIFRSATTIAAAKINNTDRLGIIKPGAIANFSFYENKVTDNFLANQIAEVWLDGTKVIEHRQVVANKLSKFNQNNFSFDPSFAFTSDYGFYLGAGLKYYNLFNQYISTGLSVGYYFNNGAKTADFSLGIPSSWQDISIINSSIHYDDLPKKFFGINNNNDAKSSYTNYKSTIVSGAFNVAKLLLNDIALKTDISLEKRKVSGIAASLVGAEGGFLPLIGLSLERDARDSFYNPWNGDYELIGVDASNKAFGSDFNFGRFKIDLRKYFLVAPYNVFSLRFLYQQALGNTPFYYLPTFGGYIGRGFSFNRFSGNIMQAWQAEYKFNLDFSFFFKHSNYDFLKYANFDINTFQILLFAELGQVQSEFSRLSLKQYNLCYGGGVRVNIIPQLEYFYAFDIGFSRDEYNILTYFGQNF